MAFVPAVALQWQFNANACVHNNLESWLRTRQWRDPGNREGAWLATLTGDHPGLRPDPLAVDIFIFLYAGLLGFWSMVLINLLYFHHWRVLHAPLKPPGRLPISWVAPGRPDGFRFRRETGSGRLAGP